MTKTAENLDYVRAKLQSHGDLMLSRWTKRSKEKRGMFLSSTAEGIFGPWPPGPRPSTFSDEDDGCTCGRHQRSPLEQVKKKPFGAGEGARSSADSLRAFHIWWMAADQRLHSGQVEAADPAAPPNVILSRQLDKVSYESCQHRLGFGIMPGRLQRQLCTDNDRRIWCPDRTQP